MAATSANPVPDDSRIIEIDKEHIIQSYGRVPLVIERAKGCYVYDTAGNRYLDFLSGIGVNALGHSHPRIVKALRDQVGKLVHCSNLYYHPLQAPLAERLARISGLKRAFFTNSGSEAVEGALKIAKIWGRKKSPEKYEIVALNNSFSGRTLGAVSVTGQEKHREPVEPLLPGIRFVDVNDEAGLEAAVSERTAAVFMEPILGEGGIVEVSRAFARKAAALAKQHDALLIFDEIQCGLGRTGSYFAFQRWNRPTEDDPNPELIHPDIITVAKPLAAGIPAGAILTNEKAGEMIGPGDHGSTFGGNALACRAAIEFLDVLDEILPAIAENGIYFERRLGELVLKYDFVSEVLGVGLMRGLKLTVEGKSVVGKAMDEGVLINCTAGTVLRFLPPYIAERRHFDQAVAVLDKIFQKGKPRS